MEIPRLQLEETTHTAAHQQEPIFLVRDLIWKEIVELLKPAEVDEVRRVLGSSTIDENEVKQVKRIQCICKPAIFLCRRCTKSFLLCPRF